MEFEEIYRACLNRSINMSAGSQAMSILRKRSQATLFSRP